MNRHSDALLRHSLELDAQWPEALPRNAPLAIDVTLRNLIDGHRVPTGSSFFRQFWLSVDVTDAVGTSVYSSGQMDPRGDLHDAHHPKASNDPDLLVLGRVLRTQRGEATLLPWRAASVDDLSLPPAGSLRAIYTVALPPETVFPLKVRVRLRFRPFPPRLLRRLGLEKELASLRVVDIRVVTGLVIDQR